MPVLALLAPALSLRRRLLVRRRGHAFASTRPLRRRHGRLVELSLALDVPFSRLREAAEALGAAAGEAAEIVGFDLGVVGIVDGEEPVLTTLRPRQGDVAERIVRDLLAGEAHRRPHLWLALRPGAYLAEAVDPFRPFRLDPDRVPAPLEQEAKVAAGVVVRRRDGESSCRLELRCLGTPPVLRPIVGAGRRWLGGLAGR